MLLRGLLPRAVIGALCLLGGAGCAEPAESPRSYSSALADGASDPLQLWQVRLEGLSAADVWLAQGTGDRALRSRIRLRALEAEHARLRPTIGAHGTIVGELTRLTNGMLVLATDDDAARLQKEPGVLEVTRAPLYRPSLASAVPVTGAPTAWTGVNGVHGEGVRIGIIDSGIDYTHADFGGSGDASEYEANNRELVEPGSFPTTRVIGGWDFAGDAYDAGNPKANTPAPDADPLDCNKGTNGEFAGGHGTHVAGIAAGNGVTPAGLSYAGNYDATLALSTFSVAPGVAPRASLVALRVFGCNGSSGLIPLALERAADPNLDGDFSDRLDVVNMSLGGAYGLGASTEVKATENLFKLGTLIVVAAGNDGDAFFDGGAPGTLRQVLTVAASEDRPWVPLHVDSPASIAGSFPSAEGPVSTPLVALGTVTGELTASSPTNGCAPFDNASEVTGRIALIDRGSCPFITKLSNALAAGALAAVVVDDQDSNDPFVMGGPGSVAIAAVLIRQKDGKKLKEKLGVGVTLRLVGGERYQGPGAEPMAGFSSRGPSIDDLRLKPDISAPGADILSAKVGSGTAGVVMFGTSMACPMAAGAAALTRQAHPTFGPGDIKALLMNTAVTLRASNGMPFPLTRQGSGRVAVDAATESQVTLRSDSQLGDVAVPFGAVISDIPVTKKASVLVENHGDHTQKFALTVEPLDALPGVLVTVAPTSLTLSAGAKATLEVTLDFEPSLLGDPPPDALTPVAQADYARHYLNEAMGHVRLTSAEGTLGLPYYAVLRAAADQHAELPIGCETNQRSGDFAIPLKGPSAHPSPLITAFELGTLDEANAVSAGNPAVAATDLRAVGIASDFATKGAIDETTLFFAVVVAGPFATPAAGPFAPIGIHIDSDADKAFEWTLSVVPYGSQPPYLDVLVTMVTNAKGEQVGERRFVNIVPRSEADSAPFVNQVLVLPVFARDIGVTAEKTTFRYAAFADRLETPTYDDTTIPVEYDVAHPLLDTAVLAPNAGRPVFLNGEPVRVRVRPKAVDEGPLPSVLLLHHNNRLDASWEQIPLDGARHEELQLSVDTRPSKATRVVRMVTIANPGTSPVEGINLTGSYADAKLVLVAPSQGSCVNATIACSLGRIEPGQELTVTLEFDAQGAVPLELQTTTQSGCVTKTSASLGHSPTVAPPNSVVSGGCTCSVQDRAGDRSGGGWGALLGAVWLLRRRERRRR